MWNVIALVLQIFHLWLKECFERDQELKDKKKELRTDAKEAIKSGDASRITGVLDRVRNS